MSKAEERAEEYCNSTLVGSPYIKKMAYLEGYHQAEKDLELTCEDISKIISIDQQVCGVMGIANYTYNHQQAMEEVLKQFKKMKGKRYDTRR